MYARILHAGAWLVSAVGFVTGADAQVVADSKDEVSTADSDSAFQFSLGLKLHPNRVTGATIVPVTTPSGTVFAADVVRSSTELTIIPFASARYKDFFVSGSHFLESRYEFEVPLLNRRLTSDRSETDVNVGYYVLSGLALSVGYKELRSKQPESGSVNFKFSGPTVGASAYGSLGSGFGLYGSAAYGRLDFKAAVAVPGADTSTYITTEVGLAYGFGAGRTSQRLVKSVTAILGYRYQSIEATGETEVATLAVINGEPTVVGQTRRKLETNSRGPVLGVVISF
jgi:hypothetical protein